MSSFTPITYTKQIASSTDNPAISPSSAAQWTSSMNASSSCVDDCLHVKNVFLRIKIGFLSLKKSSIREKQETILFWGKIGVVAVESLEIRADTSSSKHRSRNACWFRTERRRMFEAEWYASKSFFQRLTCATVVGGLQIKCDVNYTC